MPVSPAPFPGARRSAARLSGAALAVTALLFGGGCGPDATAPRPAASAARIGAATARGLRRNAYGSDVSIDGSVISATADDGTTLAVDVAAHTVNFDGMTATVTQATADSLRNTLLRMQSIESAVTPVLDWVPASGCVDAVRCAPVYADPGRVGRLDGEGARGAGPRARLGGGTTLASGLLPTRVLSVGRTDFSPGVTCLDISRAIYDEISVYRTSKLVLLGALVYAGKEMFKVAKALPKPYDPTSWWDLGQLYVAAPALDLTYATYESSRTRLNYYALLFRAQDCFHATDGEPVGPQAPGGGGHNGAPSYHTCEIEYWYDIETGEIVDQSVLSCQ